MALILTIILPPLLFPFGKQYREEFVHPKKRK